MLSQRYIFLAFLILVTILGYLTLTQWPQGLENGLQTVQTFYASTPWLSKAPETPPPTWFLGIFTGPGSIARRHIIRSTWAKRYTHPSYEYRFMMGDISKSPWRAVIEAENATYGDMWAMEDYKNENYETANKIKNMEYFSYMAKQHRLGRIRRYDFVSKVDDDNWLNLPVYWESFMSSRLPGGEDYHPEAMTMVARPFSWSKPYVFPSGRLYTVSWPLVEFYANKFTDSERKKKAVLTEDQLMGHYLNQDKPDIEFVVLEYEQAYDIGVEFVITNKTDTMMVHSIKSDQQMIEIGDLFDDKGKWNGKKLEGATNFNRTAPEMIRRFGTPSPKELEDLQAEWAKGAPEDPLDSLDWKLIHNVVKIENREALGKLYPLNRRHNNMSTGCVPLFLNPTTGRH